MNAFIPFPAFMDEAINRKRFVNYYVTLEKYIHGPGEEFGFGIGYLNNYSVDTFYNSTIGLSFSLGFNMAKHLRLRFHYQPTFVRFDPYPAFDYEHFISMGFGWSWDWEGSKIRRINRVYP